jgi:hypothetical protein
MKAMSLALPAGLLAAALAISPAHAIPRTFVASTGAGSACTRAAPCATFQAAHDATDAGGEINCLDGGTFGSEIVISKSITIDCTGTLGSIEVGMFGIGVDTPGVVVRVRNLTLRAPLSGGFSAGGVGIVFFHGAALIVEKCTFTAAGSLSAAIGFQPVGVAARLFVTDTTITEAAAGIGIAPATDGSARAIIDGVRVAKSRDGLIAGVPGSGPVAVQVRNSVFTGGSEFGIAARNTGSVAVDRTSSTLNQNVGVGAEGGAVVLLGRSTAMSNAPGLGVSPDGLILSYRNNHLTGNNPDGPAPGGIWPLR